MAHTYENTLHTCINMIESQRYTLYIPVPTEGREFDARIQGGLLADAVNSFLACVATSMPNTTMSQVRRHMCVCACMYACVRVSIRMHVYNYAAGTTTARVGVCMYVCTCIYLQTYSCVYARICPLGRLGTETVNLLKMSSDRPFGEFSSPWLSSRRRAWTPGTGQAQG